MSTSIRPVLEYALELLKFGNKKIFYSVFGWFLQFRVLHFGLVHYGSDTFNLVTH